METKKMSLKDTIVHHLKIYGIYLFGSSLFLLNHSGGADIFFLFLLVVSLIVHLIYALTKDVKTKTTHNSLFVIGLVAFTIVFMEPYMDMMWLITNKII